jgi:signal transduction histidine kinase
LEYNYREEQKRFLEDIKNTNNIDSLANKIVTQADELIPVEKIGFFLLHKESRRISVLAHKGFEILEGRSILFDEKNLKTDLHLPVAVDDQIEEGVATESADLAVFRRWGIVLIFPIKSLSGEFYSFFVVGAKKSGARFYKDDVDLMNTISATAALSFERIRLQEELIFEHLETERLAELNKMKSKFVSTVTHELKTPLTGIKTMGELLQMKFKNQSKESLEYLQIIDGESDRLQGLINNLLDFAKIEEGIKRYEKTPISFNQFIRDTLEKMNYQFKMGKIELVKIIPDEEYIINADEQSVEEAIINLLSNSIKYSEKNTTVTVSTFTENQYVCIKIEDEGYGISETELDDIFKPFYRTQDIGVVKKEGTGLGLAIVKDIMDAHKGKIVVDSTLGKGSSFILQFQFESSN